MKVIESSIDIARSPQEVFGYVTDTARLHEWQPSVNEAAAEPPRIRAVGMRGYEVRRVPGRTQKLHWEVTEFEEGSTWTIEGIDGPVRAHAAMLFAPTDGDGTHVDYRIWFEGRGIGKLIKLMATRGARAGVPASLALLKQRLEEADASRPTQPR
jgi:uncharacterized protein YndB with AHSA1/START domain